MNTDQKKTVLIAGGSGMIGTRLAELLKSNNFEVKFLSRHKNELQKDVFQWDPEKGVIDENAIRSADVLINLAGEGIADKRWTSRRKRKIVNSRMFSTNLLYKSLSEVQNKVQLVINASAVGIYGDTGMQIMHEEQPAAQDFLGQTCLRWENAGKQFEKLKIRTVILRIGLVLSTAGGFLPKILQPFKFGIATYLGSGEQYQSWIHIDDLCKMILKAIKDENLNGIYNAVAPGPLNNKNLTKLISHILGGGHLFIQVPSILLKLIFGEMSVAVIGGTRASSEKIEKAGFSFKYPQANQAIRNLLGK